MAKCPIRCIDVLGWTNRGVVKASGTDARFYRTQEHGGLRSQTYDDISAASIERLNRIVIDGKCSLRAGLCDTHIRVEIWLY